MELELSTSRDGEICVVHVAGEVDVYTSPSLKVALADATGDGCRVIIADLGKVPFIDSSGLGVLVGALRRVREAGGELRLVSEHEAVVKILRITGLDRVFPLYATLDQAMGA
jgi:anti-sigma B factor antagonist